MKSFPRLLLALAVAAIASPALAAGSPYPAADLRPVVNTYHGVAVTDSYQWLENVDDPDVKSWLAKENRLTRERLDTYGARQIVADRVKTLFTSSSSDYYGLVE